jgi:diguanylate cyclase (GGDEF)-like protein
MRSADRRPPSSLRSQIVSIFGALVMGLALVMSIVFAEFLALRTQQQAAETLHSIARNAAVLMAEGLLERSREVEVLSKSEILWRAGLDSTEVRALLARSQAMHPNSLWLGVADTEGIVRAATGGLLEGQSVKERPWFTAGLQAPFVGDVHAAKLLATRLPAPATGEPLRFLDFSAPVRVGGRTLGVLGIHGSWDWARQVIDGLLPFDAVQRGMALYIFDREGTLIYAPGGRTEALRAAGQRLPLAAPRSDGEAHAPRLHVVRWQDGEQYLTSSVHLEPRNAASDLGWQVVARQPEAIALAPTRNAFLLALAVGAVAALLAGALAWMAARRLSLDLTTVAKAATRVERAEPGASIPIMGSSREVLTLSTSMHHMTARLLRMNEEMEEQVRERTRALEQANQELDRQVRHDPLTGVLNRRGFRSQCDLALALARRGHRPLALLMVDADHFKRVNDTWGHDVGDEVLKFLAATMVERLRSSDVVARLGGEEFVALLPDTDAEAALGVAQSLLAHVSAHRHAQAGQVTVSVGLATLEGEADDAEALLRRADEALYAAKHQGRNRVVVWRGAEVPQGPAVPPTPDR